MNTYTSRFATSFPSLSRSFEPGLDHFTLARDIPLGVMPLGGRSHRWKEFSVKVIADQDHLEHVLRLLVSLKTSHDYNSLSRIDDLNWYVNYVAHELVSDVIKNIATNLAWFGRIIHEIVWDHTNNYHKLVRIPNNRLLSGFGMYLQVIPKLDRETWNKTLVLVPKQHVWDITIPKELGGLTKYRTIINKLGGLTAVVPAFWREEIGNPQNQTSNFDIHRYKLEQDIYKARITAQWGWIWSDYTLKNWTELYLFYRILQFKWAQAILREHILNELNILFSRLEIDASIVIKGLPSSSDIKTVRQRMLDGQVKFQDASDTCSV